MEILQSKPINPNTYKITFTATPTHGSITLAFGGGYTWTDKFYHNINEVITFTGTLTGLPTSAILAWDWDFGDGTRGSGQTITHTYKAYSPTTTAHLRVQLSNGWTDIASMNMMLIKP